MHSIIIEHNWICLALAFGNTFFSLRATEKRPQNNIDEIRNVKP